MDLANKDCNNFPYLLLRIYGTLFSVSSKYILKVESLPKTITQVPHSLPYTFMVNDSSGRTISTIDLDEFFCSSINKEEKDIKFSTDCPSQTAKQKYLLVLCGTPYKGLITEQVEGLEWSENLFQSNSSTFKNDYFSNYFSHRKTREIIIELNIPKMLSFYPQTDA